MDPRKHDQSIGQFQQLSQEFMTYTASEQLSPPNQGSRKIATAQKTQKPKLKIINQSDQKDGIQSMLNPMRKQRKNISANSKVIAIGDAIFRSNFESGNIQSVEKTAPSTYQITLNKQLNSQRTSAWFFFVAQGLKGEVKFVIKGFTKSSSLYNEGMKICYRQAQEGKWRRGGTKICYTDSYNQNQDCRQTYELHFSYFFKSNYPNSVQFAYCFPYTYSNLIKFLSLAQDKINLKSLGKTYQGRQIPIVTVGNQQNKHVIVITARAHPGQTVGSLMMQGFLKQLISDSSEYSKYLKQAFLFKIIPMINPDGVVNGNYRFSAAGFDLNRKWKTCTTKMHPEVYLIKQKIKQISKQKNIIMFIDLHGHSRQKNAFFYGCCPKNLEQNAQQNTKPKQFPFLMSKIHSIFRYDYCSYAMQKQKQGTARITLWNQLKIDYIYTLQASFCGAEGSANFLINDYQKIGAKLCQGICLHFWSLVKQNLSKTNSAAAQTKMNQQIKKNMNEFFQNPQLANVQFEGNSSDSEPEAGEIPQNQRKKQKSVISIQKYYKASRVMKFIDKNHLQQQNSLLKSKNSINSKVDSNLRNKTNQSVKFSKFPDNQSKLLPQSKSQIRNVSTQFTPKSQNQFYVRAQFLNRTINQRLRFELTEQKSDTQNDKKQNLNSQPFAVKNQNNQICLLNRNQHQKNKKKAISFQGAQYRRVRKLAQQHNKRHFSAQHSTQPKQDQTLIRGLVGMNNVIQIERGLETRSKQRAPSFFPNSTHYHKSRKASMQMHFRRQIKATDYTSRRFYVNGLEQEVKCYGKQIV